MRTFSLLKGLPVYDEVGKVQGHVCDLVISNEGSVMGLLMNRKTLFKKTCLVSLRDVVSFASKGITVRQIPKSSTMNHNKVYTLQHQRAIANKMIMNDYGEEMGLLDDVYFSEQVGTIVAYEISNGFFSDITDGKKTVHARKPPSLGGDTIEISPIMY
ncbi:PRC-barrel domain-containing protein [Bacillus massiliigorillae]|uniref:PRC-barrel domain-containing protein n=1 Tax=Bacillus massiliigorillae TaxID=1243664 RepID=UPI0003A894F1|nr:PRC-barrel domain-containing protein [Bacillus massiliigorillae]